MKGRQRLSIRARLRRVCGSERNTFLVTRLTNMASSMGTAAGTDIPIEHLDFEYIGKCTNAEEVEKILRVLR